MYCWSDFRIIIRQFFSQCNPLILGCLFQGFGHGPTIWNVAIRIGMSKQSNELRVLSEGETEISSDDNSKHLFTEFSRCHDSFGWKNIGWRREIIVENVFWSR